LTATLGARYAEVVTTRYKQPSRINSVSIGLVVVLGLGAWVGISAWPLIAANANVKDELEGALPRAYRANLLPEPTATEAIQQIRDELAGKLAGLGVADQKREVVILRDQKKVAIEARYSATLVLRGLKKSYPMKFHPRVETDAGRVEW
jgi:hypothetical protein